MAKYMLFKYDDKQFESEDKIRMFPIKRVELTNNELSDILWILEQFCDEHCIIDEPLIDKIKKVLKNDETNTR